MSIAIRNPIPGVVYASADDAAAWLAAGDWLDMTLGAAVERGALNWGDRPAFISDERTLTFRDLESESAQLAAGFLKHGFKPGERLIMQLSTSVDTVVIMVALHRAGLIPVCSIPQYREIEIRKLVKLSGATGYVVQNDGGKFDLPAFAARMQAELPQLATIVVSGPERPEIGPGAGALAASVAPGEAAAMLADVPVAPGDVISFQLSGGTTGVPKIIPRFHAEYLGHALSGMRSFGYDGSSRLVWPLPLLHNAAQLYAMLPPILLGSSTVLMPRLDMARMFELIEEQRVTHALSIGPVAGQILGYRGLREHDLSSLKVFGTMNNAHALEAAIGVPSVNFYGITEGMLLGSGPEESVTLRHFSNGITGAATDRFRLVDPETRQPVPEGHAGEFAFRGPSSLRAYYAAPEETAKVLDDEGFFFSGDIMAPVTVDGGTAFLFQGRTRDNINRGGEKIGCEEVEALLVKHPAVADAKLVAMPDPIYGEKGCLFVIPAADAKAPSVGETVEFLVGQGLAKFKCPERIETIDEFPVTRVGKLDRGALRKLIADKISEEAGAEPRSPHSTSQGA